MKISWMGHSCFFLELEKGKKILTDPYQPGGYSGAVAYGPVGVEPDYVTVSHQHSDHNYTAPFPRARVIDKAGVTSCGEVAFEGIVSHHDPQKGVLRGANLIFVISAEGMRVAHLGDLGDPGIDPVLLGTIDIAFIPIGGTFTLSAGEAGEFCASLNPRIVIPMHFKTEKLGFAIDGVEPFLSGRDFETRDCLEVNSQTIEGYKPVVVLAHQR